MSGTRSTLDWRLVSRLLVLNGPPGVGKSTLAQRYLQDHPRTLNLDLDRLRRFVGGWREDPLTAYGLAREFGLAAARVHLQSGHDVVVPQYLGHLDYLQRLAALADETGSTHHEFVLLESKDRILARFAARTAAAADLAHPDAQVHLDAQAFLDAAGGAPQLEAMYDRLLLLLTNRPQAQLLPAPDGDVEATYQGLLTALSR